MHYVSCTMTDYMVTGLVKRRAEIAGELRAAHDRVGQLVRDLAALDEALRVVAPDVEVEAIRPKMFRPPEDWSNRGQMSRIVLSILRQARDPLTTPEIAAQLVIERGLDAGDKKLMPLMVRRVGACLRHKREQGHVESLDGPGNYLMWQIVRP